MPVVMIILIILGLFLLFLSLGAHGLKGKAKEAGDEKEYKSNSVLFVVFLSLGLCLTVGPVIGIIMNNINSDNTGHSYSEKYEIKSESKYENFTNEYGTPTTKCAVSGCDNYIAKSGDTNCCTTHSNRCGECNCYIDGDAMFCMECIEEALGG